MLHDALCERYRPPLSMNINQVLFLIATLNLLGDLYNILRFRHQLPGWLPLANISTLTVCGTSWLLAPDICGTISLGAFVVYLLTIRLLTRNRARRQHVPAPMTKLLISANVCFFLYQALQGAAENPTQFVEVGALSSQLLQEGEWWRLFTAQFLHWGVLHLFCNMLGLWFLGPPTESLLGSFRFLGAYLACGTLGMLIAYGFSLLSPDPHPIVLLGASASVLGLVGIQAAFALRAYRHSGSPVAKAQLSSMLQIVVLQAIFDTMVPEVSSTAHTGGAAVGFLIGLVASSSMMRARQPLSH